MMAGAFARENTDSSTNLYNSDCLEVDNLTKRPYYQLCATLDAATYGVLHVNQPAAQQEAGHKLSPRFLMRNNSLGAESNKCQILGHLTCC